MTALFEQSPWLVLGCAAALFAGGLVKGAIGIGLPLVAAPALATLLGVKQAVAVLTLPVLLANLWQAWYGGHYYAVLRRFWPLIVALSIGIIASTALVATLDPQYLFLLLGAAVVAYPLTVFLRIDFRIAPQSESWAAPIAGTVAGFLSGFSYFFGPPLAIYFSALRLPKDLFVAGVALIGLIAAVLTGLFLAHNDILETADLVLSGIAAIPTLLGTLAGTWLRRFINEESFRRAVAIALLVIGLNLLRRALL